MFVDVNNLLDLNPDVPPNRQTISISSSRNDHSFLLHHFLTLYIKNNYNVCFLALEQSYGHFNNVATKLGANLNAAKTKKQLIFIEGLKHFGDVFLTDKSTELVEQGAKQCYELISKSFDTLLETDRSKPVLIMVDNLSVLVSLGISPVNVLDLAHYLRVLAYSHSNTCLVLGSQWDQDGTDEENELIYRALFHQSTMCIEVSSLPSGYCKDVHGQIKVTTSSKSYERPTVKTMQYKMTDKNVCLFPLGFSAAVL